MKAAFFAALVLASAFVSTTAARADLATARELFDQGTAALEEGRFPQARDLFIESLEHHPNAATAFNLVLALRGAEQPTRALEHCTALTEGRYGALSTERGEQVRHVCRQIAEEVARLSIFVRGVAGEARIAIDGQPAGALREGAPMLQEVDPGRHVVTATAPAHAAAERSIEVTRGEVARITLDMMVLADRPAALDSAARGTDWWMVAGISGGVLAAAAVAAIVIVIITSQPKPPTTNDVFPEPLPT